MPENLLENQVMRVLGAVMVVPPRHEIETYGKEEVARLVDGMEKRFSEDGRLRFAREACEASLRNGWGVPDEDGGRSRSVEECAESVLDRDYEMYPEDMVEAAIDQLKRLFDKQPSPQSGDAPE